MDTIIFTKFLFYNFYYNYKITLQNTTNSIIYLQTFQ